MNNVLICVCFVGTFALCEASESEITGENHVRKRRQASYDTSARTATTHSWIDPTERDWPDGVQWDWETPWNSWSGPTDGDNKPDTNGSSGSDVGIYIGIALLCMVCMVVGVVCKYKLRKQHSRPRSQSESRSPQSGAQSSVPIPTTPSTGINPPWNPRLGDTGSPSGDSAFQIRITEEEPPAYNQAIDTDLYVRPAPYQDMSIIDEHVTNDFLPYTQDGNTSPNDDLDSTVFEDAAIEEPPPSYEDAVAHILNTSADASHI